MYLYDDDELNCTHTLIGSYDLLVLTYDLLEDRDINDITINIFFYFWSYKTDKIYVAVHLFSNRSQKT